MADDNDTKTKSKDRQKTTHNIVFLGEPAVRSCKNVRSKWSGNWYKITSNFYIYMSMLNIVADVYIFGQSHVENVTSWQKMTDTIVFLGEPAVRLCKEVRSKWSGNWYKITSNLLFFAQRRAAVHRPNGEHLLGTLL
jgi:hypothetical protein